MSVVKLTKDHVTAIWNEQFPFNVEGDTYDYYEELSEEMDDDGRTVTFILRRQRDGAFFETYLYYARYGYEDYSFEADLCELEMTEVHKVTKTIEVWEAV